MYKKNLRQRTSLSSFLSPLLLASLISAAYPVLANDKEEIERQKSLIEQLDQRVKILDRKQEIATEDAAAKQKTAPVLVAGEKGFSFKSADGQFEYKFRGIVQLDYRTFGDDAYPTAVNGFLARRIRPTFEGTVFGKYGFRFTPEFAESGDGKVVDNSGSVVTNKTRVVDAYLDARLDPKFQVRLGKFKPVVGLERLQGAADTKFIERSFVSGNFLPNRDLGVSVSGELLDNKLNYAVGIYNGIIDGGDSTTAQDVNTGKDFTARLFATPFVGDGSKLEGLGFGLAATSGNTTGNALASYKTPGQVNSFFGYATGTTSNGQRTRFAPQANYYYGPVGILTEYAVVNQDIVKGTNKARIQNNAWHVTASWLLTGEDASFKGVKPNSPFTTDGGWGAWELVARYQENTIDADAVTTTFATTSANATSAKTWGLGLNWYHNQSSKVAINWEQTSFDGGVGSKKLNGKKEDFLVARYQLAF